MGSDPILAFLQSGARVNIIAVIFYLRAGIARGEHYMTGWVPWAVIASSVFGLAIAALFAYLVLKADPGNGKMQDISRSIQEGAMAFVSREYRYVGIFVILMVLLLSFLLRDGWMTALCYVFGASCSLGAGFVGLSISTRANSRTTEAARTGVAEALTVAFRSGAVMGMTVAGLGLLGLTVCYLVFEVWLGFWNSAYIILGFSLGASSVALFARVGGGIFTKAADVGADLVGKVEAGIPEDDPRNPAVIADNVGDNVCDVAGMGADLYESYVASIIAAMSIAFTSKLGNQMILYPLLLAAVGTAAAMIGSRFVTGSESSHPQKALNMGSYVSGGLVIVASALFALTGLTTWNIFFATISGL